MMASSDWNATSSSPQRFNDYLNGLREEFDLQSNATSPSARRFNIFLGNLKGEFELMGLEIESLQKERREFGEKVQDLAQRLQDVRRNIICEQCGNKGIALPLTASSPQLNTSVTSCSPSSKPVFQPKSLRKRRVPSRVVNPSEQPLRRSARHMTVASSPQPAVTPTESVSLTTSRLSTPSPLPQMSASADHLDPSHQMHGCSITFNDEIEKELDVEMVHLSFHRKRIRCVRFSQDGKYLAAACKDGNAYVYDVQTGTLTCVLRNLLTERDYVRVVCFSRDGKYLATGSTDGNIYIWEINTKYVRNAFKGHTRWIPSLDFSPNGRLIVSSHGNTVRIWNIRDGATKFLTEDNPTFLDNPCYASTVFSPDGKYVAASHRDGVVRIWGVSTAALLRRVKAHVDWVFDIALMPDGKGLLSGSTDTTLSYWDIGSLYANSGLRTNGLHVTGVEEQTWPEREFSGHTDFVCSIAISPDGKWVASGSRDQSVRIWDSRSAVLQCILNNVHKEVWAVDFSPAGGYLASAGYDGTVRIWRYSHMTS